MEAGDWMLDSERYLDAANYYARAEKLAEGFGPDDPRLARTPHPSDRSSASPVHWVV